jgi:LacI family transcriptional regulator
VRRCHDAVAASAIHATSTAHDLDADNRRLLRERRISAVLHNDLRADARLAMRLILEARNVLPSQPVRPTPVQVVTPYNVPA